MADDTTILARLKVANKTGFIADLRASSAAVVGFGVANEEAAAATKLSAVESFGLRQGLYTLRRELFYGSAAALAFAAGALKLGLTFDEAQASGTAAFSALLGGEQAAGREMANLTNITHQTGVQLSTLTGYAEEMQGFGISIRDVNTDLKALSDFAERTGSGSAGLGTLVSVFDRIQQAGKMTSLDLRTLTKQGVPALKILSDQLHLTQQQQHLLQTGKLIIPAQYALPALTAGIQQRANQLGPNLTQEVGITHTYLSSLLGGGEGGVFSFMTHGLATLNAALKVASQGGGVSGFLNTLNPSGNLLAGWTALVGLARGVAGGFKLIWLVASPLITTFATIFRWSDKLGGSSTVLGIALRGLGFAVKVLTALYVVDRTRLLGVWVAQKLLKDEMIVSTVVTKGAAAAMWLLNAAMDANPVVLIVAGIVALAGGLYLLYTRVKPVRDLMGAIVQDVNWLQNKVIDISVRLHLGGKVGSGILDALPGIGQARQVVGVIHQIAGLAGGGTTLTHGSVLVGERGPELLNLPAAARVTPLASPGVSAVLKPIIEMYVDGKMIARVVADHVGPVAEASARYKAQLGATA